jgi:tetratricopeptide (TPR) repeat protein
VPYPRITEFAGRQDLLSQIHTAFAPDGPGPATVAITGPSGVGKSAAAVEYTFLYEDEYDAIFFLHADTETALQRSLARIARTLSLPEADGADLGLAAEAAAEWLRSTGRWLVVLDNVESRGIVRSFLADRLHGHVIVTSAIPSLEPLAFSILLGPLSDAEASDMVTRALSADPVAPHADDAVDFDRFAELSHELFGSPHVTSLATAFILAKRLHIPDYLAMYRAKRAALLDAGRLSSTNDEQNATSVAVSLTLEALRLDMPSAERLASYCAVIGAEAIPAELFVDGGGLFEQEPANRSLDGAPWGTAVAGACAYRLLDANSAEQALWMPRPVRAAIQETVETDGLRDLQANVVCAMDRVLPEPRRSNWAEWERFTPHLHAYGTQVDGRIQWIAPDEQVRLHARAGSYLRARGQHLEAESLLQSALAICDSTSCHDVGAAARVHTELGNLFRDQRQYPTALEHYLRALALREEQPDGDEAEIATALNLVANVYSIMGNDASARPLYERSLSIRERTLGPDHPATATSLNNLGIICAREGDQDAARDYYRRSLSLREQVCGPEHLDTAASMYNLANLNADSGDYAGARQLYERVIAIREARLGPCAAVADAAERLGILLQRVLDYGGAQSQLIRAHAIRRDVLGADHPDTVASVCYLARLYADQGDYNGALPLYQFALDQRDRMLGEDHADTVQTAKDMADLHTDNADFGAAAPFYDRWISWQEHALGPDDASVADGLASLALHHQREGNIYAARRLYERALVKYDAATDRSDPAIAVCLSNLALLCQREGDYNTARPLFERAVAIRTEEKGSEGAELAASLCNLANLLHQQGDYSTARPLYERALAIRDGDQTSEHPSTATTLNNLALLCQRQGENGVAKDYFERALAIRMNILGPEHPETGTSMSNLASLLHQDGNLADAKPLYEQALSIRESTVGPDHPDTATVLSNLAILHHQQGLYESARPLYERVLAIRDQALGPDHPDTIRARENYAQLRA